MALNAEGFMFMRINACTQASLGYQGAWGAEPCVEARESPHPCLPAGEQGTESETCR